MFVSPRRTCIFALLSLAAAELWREEQFLLTHEETKIFKTQPEFDPVVLRVINKTEDASSLQPGYIFVAPHIFHIGFGPHIFTQDGELIWYGQGVVGSFNAHLAQAMDFTPCDYLGESGTHFCFSEGRPKRHSDLDPARRTGGVNRIFDNTYTQVGKDMARVAGYDYPNPHEFTMTIGANSYLQAIFHKKGMDLRPYRGRPHGAVYEPCFQEADLRTRRQIFRWCYLDRHPIWHTDLFLSNKHNAVNKSTKVGGKGTNRDPWDFAHLNSLDKNLEGDYLVSLRHLDQIMKIAGPDNAHGVAPGTTLWRLGGKGGNIKFKDKSAIFSRQHHSRFIRTTAEETVFSVFDNAYDGTYNSSQYSSAKIIAVNNKTKTARLVKEYPHPFKRLAASQGSVQVLPGGNVFVGWGARPQVTEFDEAGAMLYHAQILPDPGNMTNYRSFKGPWVGKPLETELKLVPYCKSCNTRFKDPNGDPFWVYVSWNGATDVVEWKFHLSVTSAYGPWIPAGTFKKKGFETSVRLERSTAFGKVASFPPWVSVQALDKNGKVLAIKTARTFVPAPPLEDSCDTEGCFEPLRFLYSEFQSRSIGCRISAAPMTAVLFILCVVIELFNYLSNKVLHRTSSPAWSANFGRRYSFAEPKFKGSNIDVKLPETTQTNGIG